MSRTLNQENIADSVRRVRLAPAQIPKADAAPRGAPSPATALAQEPQEPVMARITQHLDTVETRLAGLQETIAGCAAPGSEPRAAVPHWQLKQHRMLVTAGAIAAIIVGTWPVWSGRKGSVEPVAASPARPPAPESRPARHQFIMMPLRGRSFARVPDLPKISPLIVQEQSPQPAPAEPARTAEHASVAKAHADDQVPPTILATGPSAGPVRPVLPEAVCSPDASPLPVMAKTMSPDPRRLPVSIRRMRSTAPPPDHPSLPSPRKDIAQLVQPAQL
jgi:hypothetical protein